MHDRKGKGKHEKTQIIIIMRKEETLPCGLEVAAGSGENGEFA